MQFINPVEVKKRASIQRRINSIIPFGDSITIGGTTENAMGSIYASGYAEASIYQSNGQFRIIRNAGVAGNTTTQMLARISADVIAYQPDACLLLGGTNDISSGMTDAAIATMMSNIEQMVIRLLTADILPIIVTPPPKNAAITEAKKVQYLYYRLAKAYRLPLLDMYRIFVNPSTGAYAAGYSADGTHLNADAIAVIAPLFAAKLADIESLISPVYLAAVSEATSGNLSNLLKNGAFAISTTPPTPDGWTVNSTNATPSLTAATLPYTGNQFGYDKSVAGAVYALYGADIATGWSVGDELEFNGFISASGLTPSTASGFNVTLAQSGGTGSHSALKSWKQNGSNLFSTNLTVTTGTTVLFANVYIPDVSVSAVNNLTIVNRTVYDLIWTPSI